MSENQNFELKDDIDDDDEFGGATISIEMLRAHCNVSTTTTDVEQLANAIATSAKVAEKTRDKQQAKDDLLKLPPHWDWLATDAEYIPVTNQPTEQFTSSIYSAGNVREYLHPECIINKNPYASQDLRRKLKVLNELQSLRAFKSPFVMLDFLEDVYGIQWREQSGEKRRYVKTLKIFMFFSFKDLQFLFAKDADFLYYCLSCLERIRRITTKFNKPLSLPYEIYLPTTKGMKWHSLSLEILDISAMQGSKPLKVYLQNVGLEDSTKGLWDWEKNGDAYHFLMNYTKKYLQYTRGDVNQLIEVYKRTIAKYNEIAETIGVEGDCENWGMSTGKITASMVSCWVAGRQNIMLPVRTNSRDPVDMKPLYWYTRLASPEALKNLSHFVGNKALLYLGMTDGGRCVKERSTVDFLDGVLCDLDIDGAYGNGLKNQIFPVGNPSIIFNAIKFKDWEKEYSKRLIPGLWLARISWKDAPFDQDLFLSKIPKVFLAWDWYQQHFSENHSDTNQQYDATMYLGTRELHMAAFTHDFYQVLLKYTSNQELAWIRENAVIEAFAYYDKDDEIPKIIPEMLEMRSVKELHTCGIKWSTKWVRIELNEMISTLIDNRGNHKRIIKKYNTLYGKKNKKAVLEDVPTSEVVDGVEYSKTDFLYRNSIQEFLKLIINTTYGCIASTYFSGEGTGISNYIVGNNITGRCRVLAWCMAKGLYSLMSITDGGVFDVNTVAFYLRKSLDIFAKIGYGIFNGSNGQKVVEIKPLYDRIIPKTEEMFDIKKDIHIKPWEHLKSQFGELHIFKYDQYSFEVKNLYTQCTIRNKSDYELYNEFLPRDKDNPVYKVRGLSQKDGDGLAALIFDDVRNNVAGIHEVNTKRLLGLNEWRELDAEMRKKLTPHDQISNKKNFYTITPLGCKFINSEHHKLVMQLYDQLKQWERPDLVEKVRRLENVASIEEFKAFKRELNAKSN